MKIQYYLFYHLAIKNSQKNYLFCCKNNTFIQIISDTVIETFLFCFQLIEIWKLTMCGFRN